MFDESFFNLLQYARCNFQNILKSIISIQMSDHMVHWYSTVLTYDLTTIINYNELCMNV